MGLVLDKWQKKALSECIGETILNFYSSDPPLWADVKTDDVAELRSLVIERLRAKKSNDIANALKDDKEHLTQAIHQRFKSLREKKRREDARKAKGQVLPDSTLQGTALLSHRPGCELTFEWQRTQIRTQRAR